MPTPPRRNSRGNPPNRRPRVAGIRKPSPHPAPPPRPAWRDADAVAETEAVAEVSPTEEAPVAEEAPESLHRNESTDAGTSTVDVSSSSGPGVAESGTAPRPRPSPRRKNRDEGAPKPESTADAESATAESAAPSVVPVAAEDPAATGRSRLRLAGALFAIALVLAGAAVFFKVMDNKASSAYGNSALIDAAKTAQAQEQVKTGVESLLSYDFNDIAKTEQAANDLLATDAVRNQYNTVFAEVKRLAPEQQMVVTCTVSRAAVTMLEEDRAKVLLFVDQTATRAAPEAGTTVGGSQLSVNAELRDGKWKFTNLETFTDGLTPAEQQQAPAPGQAPAPENQAPAPESPQPGN